MVLDGGLEYLEPVELCGEPGCEGGHMRTSLLAHEASGLGRGVRRHDLDRRQILRQEPAALPSGVRERHETRRMERIWVPSRSHQVEVHIEHDLALDQQVDLEHQTVERRADSALDRVLDRQEAEIDLLRS